MNAWIVYENGNTQRNYKFIRHWINLGKEKGVKFKLVLSDQLFYGVENNKLALKLKDKDERPDFALMRLSAPFLSQHMEDMGIPVFNNAHVAHICNDKRLTHAYLAGQVPMIDTAFVDISSKTAPFKYPVVVKASNSCGGRKVFLCKDDQEYVEALKLCYPDTAVVQPLSDTLGKDVRVYVLGNKILQPMMRFSTDGDFRSNIGQGGDATPFELDLETKKYVEKIISNFDFSFVGIDFIFNKGKLLFNEIEDAVGTRMLFAHTAIDPVQEYLNYIIKQLG
ncbi:MAG: ATP-grasp domain-containing protein [Eubacteriales bacterium]|nr:ATP-grasp domain-containing protein [Eubacteriales bacterium]